MEIGCRSALGCAQMPWDFTHTEFPVNEDEQANFFESSMAALSDKEWFAGYFWWDWGTIVYHTKEEAAVDDGFNIHLRKRRMLCANGIRSKSTDKAPHGISGARGGNLGNGVCRTAKEQ